MAKTIGNDVRAEKDTPKTDTSVDMNVGGQAVIEGVMMRSPKFIATAVRLPDGTIELNKKPFKSFITRYKFLNIPIIRGAINFVEMLIIGIDTLNWSADIQMKFEDKKEGIEDSKSKRILNVVLMGFTFIFAFSLAMLLFFMLPIFIATLLGLAKGALLFNLVAGIIRLVLFLTYIVLISKMKDIQRIFRYHGAEHMSIFAFEASEELNVESTRNKSRFHPRCGTSFILIVVLFSIVLLGTADSLFPHVFGHMQSLVERFATHIALLPFVAGISYELLKLSGRFRSNQFVKLLILPGLWLQKLTTGHPDDDMLEVALCALNAAIDAEEI
ncbi:DUF1385 domain-containing protein [Candidatus Latescibacterota bacterium]